MRQTRKTALIVDDEMPVQYALLKLLEQWGYLCVGVSSGQEALDRVATREFDLMLLDVRMPGMSGLEVLKVFREDNPGASVVMLSAVIDKALTTKAIKLGADDCVLKPCSPDELRTKLQRAYERREQTRKGGPEPAQKQLNFGEVTEELVYPADDSSLRGIQAKRLGGDVNSP